MYAKEINMPSQFNHRWTAEEDNPNRHISHAMKGWGTEGDVVLLELLSGTGLAERSSQGFTRGIIFKVEQVEEHKRATERIRPVIHFKS